MTHSPIPIGAAGLIVDGPYENRWVMIEHYPPEDLFLVSVDELSLYLEFDARALRAWLEENPVAWP